MTVGQGPIVLAVDACGGCLDIFSLVCLFSFLSPSLWETARYRLKYCLKGPLNPKQPTNQPFAIRAYAMSAVGIDVVSVYKLYAYRVVSTVSTDIVSSHAKYCRIAYGITR